MDSHNENLSGHSTDSKYLHIYKGCFHRDAKESNASYFRGSLIYYGGLLSPLGQQTFFEGGFHQGRCQLVAQTQGYQLVCIWGSLVEFRGRGGCSKEPVLCWIVDFAEISTGTYPCFSKLSVAFKLRGFGSSWMSAYCTDTGLSAGMHLG